MKFIDLDGKKIAYKDTGEGPALLFGHSYLWDHHMWDAVIDKLSTKFRCIAADLPAHGASQVQLDVDLKKLAEHQGSLMRELGIEKYSVIGLSIGAMWGSYLVANNSVNIDSFIIINSSLLPEPQEKVALYEGMLKAVDNACMMPAPVLDAIVPSFFSETVDSEVVHKFRQSLECLSPDQIPGITACGRAFINRGNILDQIKTSGARVSVIAGKYDQYRPVHESEQMATELDCPMHIIETGHISAVEKPNELAELIESLLV